MNRFTLAAALGLLTVLLKASSAQTFQPLITDTVGTGSNISYFVINFNDGPGNTNTAASDFAFAYHYDGTKTGSDMIAALESQVGLGVTSKVDPTYGLEYLGFSFDGHSATGDGSAGSPGYWGYFNSPDGQNWNYAPLGADQTLLSNDSWDAWSWAPKDASIQPVTPVAAPEPSSDWIFALGAGTLGLVAVRRRRQA